MPPNNFRGKDIGIECTVESEIRVTCRTSYGSRATFDPRNVKNVSATPYFASLYGGMSYTAGHIIRIVDKSLVYELYTNGRDVDDIKYFDEWLDQFNKRS